MSVALGPRPDQGKGAVVVVVVQLERSEVLIEQDIRPPVGIEVRYDGPVREDILVDTGRYGHIGGSGDRDVRHRADPANGTPARKTSGRKQSGREAPRGEAEPGARFPADVADRVHISLLAGLLSHIGMRDAEQKPGGKRRGTQPLSMRYRQAAAAQTSTSGPTSRYCNSCLRGM